MRKPDAELVDYMCANADVIKVTLAPEMTGTDDCANWPPPGLRSGPFKRHAERGKSVSVRVLPCDTPVCQRHAAITDKSAGRAILDEPDVYCGIARGLHVDYN